MEGNLTNLGTGGSSLNGTGSPVFNSSVFRRGTQSLSLSTLVTVPSINLRFTTGITFAFWVYPISNSVTWNIATFTNGTDSFDINWAFNNISLRITAPVFGESLNSNIQANTWVHIAISMTYSTSTTSTWNMYRNGTLENTYTSVRPYFAVNNYTTNRIGGITGYLDDFRIYNTVLSGADITTVYNSDITNINYGVSDYKRQLSENIINGNARRPRIFIKFLGLKIALKPFKSFSPMDTTLPPTFVDLNLSNIFLPTLPNKPVPCSSFLTGVTFLAVPACCSAFIFSSASASATSPYVVGRAPVFFTIFERWILAI